MEKFNNKNATEIKGGLFLETSPERQPKGTYRFALNTVTETTDGDKGSRSNEESNAIFSKLKPGYILIGSEYMTQNRVAILSVSADNKISEIGMLLGGGVYETHVNDANATDKLNFTKEHQIQIEYRLRRGCEDTIYFTDNNEKPRYYNYKKPKDFQDESGKWVGNRFTLAKEYEKIPTFNEIKVLNSGGNLPPGSYNIAVQLLDGDMNPTEWITTSDIVKIYNDSLNNKFNDIDGSINSEAEYLNFGNSNKSIQITVGNLDQNYTFYRLAIIEANNGSGMVNRVIYTDTIPVSNTRFTYTGENGFQKGTEEEILFFNDVIHKAGSILQIENRLILAETQGPQINYCELQKYASKITADCVLKEMIVNSDDIENSIKDPTLDFYEKGNMPGEIQSYGVVYIFEGNILSPVCHIPGKGSTESNLKTYTKGANVKPMKTNNRSLNNKYFEKDSCSGSDYWGVDSQGIALKDTFVRHHRFPKRSEIDIPLVEEVKSTNNSTELYKMKINIKGKIDLPISCPKPPEDCVEKVAESFLISVKYSVGTLEYEVTYVVNPGLYQDNVNGTYNMDLDFFSPIHTQNELTLISISEVNENGTIVPVTVGVKSPKNLVYTKSVETYINTSKTKLYKTNILGIKFSNIEMPPVEVTGGYKVIGYYIVKNERTRFEKTVIDTGVLTPSLINTKYISHGLLQPEVNQDKLSKDTFGLITPGHKFNKEEISDFTSMEQEGNFTVKEVKYGKFRVNDALDGTSFNEEWHKKGELEDENNQPGIDDGWSLKCILRDTITKFNKAKNFVVSKENIKELFYLNAVESRDINDGLNTIYNISSDNKIGILQVKDPNLINIKVNNLPYVVLNKDNADPYSNFRSLPYYKETLNPIMFNESGSTPDIYHGDTTVQPMRYVNTVFWDNSVAERAGRTNAFNYIIGGALVALGAILSFVIPGASLLVVGAGISIMGGGALYLASGIQRDAMFKAYGEEYKKGLRETALDNWVNRNYVSIPNHRNGPMDDEIRWIADCVTDLWFDTDIDIALRHKIKGETPTYLNSPGKVEDGNVATEPIKEYFGKYRYWDWTLLPVSSLEKHVMRKLTIFDGKRKDARMYLGAALGEYYEVNPDYQRFNKQKIFNHLPIEYDCCSDCRETFPHRYHHSEQSFQEELTDNFRVFLPNNYRDLEGETGRITNMFKISNNMYIHTEEALWEVPRNQQERVTDQIVSFIGTGSYFEIPPRPVLDSVSGNSAGSSHKWATTKTPIGVSFVSENERKVYLFDGKNCKPISNSGLESWFRNNLEIKNKQRIKDNPANKNGSGFISVYDPQKKRLILTKKDSVLQNNTFLENSWTISYSLEESQWISWHSYFPEAYIGLAEGFLSWKNGDENLWKHNIKNSYQTFYGFKKPFIIEYVSNGSPGVTKITDSIEINADVKKYSEEYESFVDVSDVFFNKVLLYNSRQCSGLLTIKQKDESDYLNQQVQNLNGDEVIIDRNERNWSLNGFRDLRVNYNIPIFNETLLAKQNQYYTDKVLNVVGLNYNKDWTQQESFRDKYLAIRLVFDTFADVKLVLNFSLENETQSFR